MTFAYTTATATVCAVGTSLVARMPLVELAAPPPINGQLSIYNAGQNGAYVDTARSNAAQREDAQFNPAKENVIIFMGATNTIWGFGKSGQTTFNEAKAYCQERLAAHPGVKIIIGTEPPRYENEGQSVVNAKNAEIDAYNALVRANFASMGAVGVADIRAPGSRLNLPDYTLASFTALDQYWDTADGAAYRVHFSSAGYTALVLPVWRSALAAVSGAVTLANLQHGLLLVGGKPLRAGSKFLSV